MRVCLITQFRMGHSADYPQCVTISCVVKCGKGVVTWISTSANQTHSARAFRILLSAFRNSAFYQNPSMTNVLSLFNKPVQLYCCPRDEMTSCSYFLQGIITYYVMSCYTVIAIPFIGVNVIFRPHGRTFASAWVWHYFPSTSSYCVIFCCFFVFCAIF